MSTPLKLQPRPLGPGQTLSNSDGTEAREAMCLHWTGGYGADGAIQWWKKDPSRVGTPYVVDLDGIVYQCYDERKEWAFSLGIANEVGMKRASVIEARTIGIEIASVGQLRLAGRELRDTIQNRAYCSLDEKERYDYVSGGFRGFQYFAAPTPAQIRSVRQLISLLASRYGIPLEFPGADRIDKVNIAHFSQFRGICSHVNFNAQKLDWPPYWPQYFQPSVAGTAA